MDEDKMNVFINKLFDIVTKYINRYNNDEKILGDSETIKILLSNIWGNIQKLKNSFYKNQLDAYKSTFNLIYIECVNKQSYFKKQYDKKETSEREQKLKFVSDLMEDLKEINPNKSKGGRRKTRRSKLSKRSKRVRHTRRK